MALCDRKLRRKARLNGKESEAVKWVHGCVRMWKSTFLGTARGMSGHQSSPHRAASAGQARTSKGQVCCHGKQQQWQQK
eukprot:1145819-Pelagomonas_calceolata.AAC.8